MNAQRQLSGIAGLVSVREAEIERLGADLARQETQRRRFVSNLEALQRLLDDTGNRAMPAASPLHARNLADYRQTLLEMIAGHRAALEVHEENMRVSRALLTAKTRRCEVWRRELAGRRHALDVARRRSEQRAQDELATQAWRRASA
jgi:flagellar export protein FliJ